MSSIRTMPSLCWTNPSGLLTVPGKHAHLQDCLEHRAREAFPTVTCIHRLDMDTSGLLVMALTPAAHAHIGRQFEKRQTEKSYIARVYGRMEQETGVVDLPLRCDWPNRPKQMVDLEQGAFGHYPLAGLRKRRKRKPRFASPQNRSLPSTPCPYDAPRSSDFRRSVLRARRGQRHGRPFAIACARLGLYPPRTAEPSALPRTRSVLRTAGDLKKPSPLAGDFCVSRPSTLRDAHLRSLLRMKALSLTISFILRSHAVAKRRRASRRIKEMVMQRSPRGKGIRASRMQN